LIPKTIAGSYGFVEAAGKSEGFSLCEQLLPINTTIAATNIDATAMNKIFLLFIRVVKSNTREEMYAGLLH
jgi:hypothetical protein